MIQQFISPLTNHRTDELAEVWKTVPGFRKMILEVVREGIGKTYHPEALRMPVEDGVTAAWRSGIWWSFTRRDDIIHVSNGLKW